MKMLAPLSLAVALFAVPFVAPASAEGGRLVCEAEVNDLAVDANNANLDLAARQQIADWVDVTRTQCLDSFDKAITNVRMVRKQYNLPGEGQVAIVPSPSQSQMDLD